MNVCPCCNIARTSGHINYYDAALIDFQTAAQASCPRCSYVLQCVVWAASRRILELDDVKKIRVWPGGDVAVYAGMHAVQLEIFKTEGTLGVEATPLQIGLRRKLLPGHTSSDDSLATIKGWIDKCSASHPDCRKIKTGFSPKRLLEIGIETIHLREDVIPLQYACLSHCWGPPDQISKLTLSTLDDLVNGGKPILFETLTQTFRDAILVCRRLDIRYLWIDSLCIIQDSRSDWLEQAVQMADIYENASLTLAATASSQSSEGFLRGTETKYLAQPAPRYEGIYIRQKPPTWPDNWTRLEHDDQREWPLLQRGWTYQEMRLSTRTLHFCAQEIMWECKTLRCSESGCSDEVLGARDLRNTMYSAVAYETLARKSPEKLWWKTVQEYSRRRLTFERDKMPALAALTERMGAIREGDRFLAGLWEKTLLLDLLWMVWPKPKPNTGRRLHGKPAWSWISVDGPVMWDSALEGTLPGVRIGKVDYTSVGPPQLGNFQGGAIELHAPLIPGNRLLQEYVDEHRTAPKANRIVANQDSRVPSTIMVYDVKEDGHVWFDEFSKQDAFLVMISGKANRSIYGLIVCPAKGGCFERIGLVQVKHRDSSMDIRDRSDFKQQDELADKMVVVLKALPVVLIRLV